VSRPVVPRLCSTFSRLWKPPESNSSARRRMDLESEFVPSQLVANERSLVPSGPPSTDQKRIWTKEQNMNMVGEHKREGRANEKKGR
jgi:hypothetical protein